MWRSRPSWAVCRSSACTWRSLGHGCSRPSGYCLATRNLTLPSPGWRQTASIEAIFLSTFVLISQNRMAEAADKRADLDLHISLLTEHELTKLTEMVEAVAAHFDITTANHPELSEIK